MADINYDDDLDENGKKKRSPVTALIAIFIILVWVAIFALLVKLDVGGFGSSVLRPVLKDVPIINAILPEEDASSIGTDSGNVYTTLQEAVARINELEDEIEIYQKQVADSAEQISNLTAENARLQVYEDNQTAFETLRKKFDEEVVYTTNAPDITAYRDWYAEIYPENAEVIYQQVLEQIQDDEVIQELAKYYSSMKAASAAPILEGMTGDMEKVAHILSNMKPAEAGAILAAMDPTIAGKLTLLIYPVEDK